MEFGLGKLLKEEYGFNLRERLNVYASPIVGSVFPIICLRYAFFPLSNNLIEEGVKYGLSTLMSIPFQAHTTTAGLLAGYGSARTLHINRDKKTQKKSLEKNIIS